MSDLEITPKKPTSTSLLASLSAESSDSNKGSTAWQERLLPTMVLIIIVSFVFFAGASAITLANVNKEITKGDSAITLPLPNKTYIGYVDPSEHTNDLDYLKWSSRAVLEKSLMERRYHQAQASLMARICVQYMGFITGMILALVGATFIMSKITDGGTEAAVEAAGGVGKYSLKSASPGIVLGVIGAALMMTTLLTHHSIDLDDTSTYLSSDTDAPASWPDQPKTPGGTAASGVSASPPPKTVRGAPASPPVTAAEKGQGGK